MPASEDIGLCAGHLDDYRAQMAPVLAELGAHKHKPRKPRHR